MLFVSHLSFDGEYFFENISTLVIFWKDSVTMASFKVNCTVKKNAILGEFFDISKNLNKNN